MTTLTEAGGPSTQAGIRYQDQVAALYLGRMIDPRERPRHDQPVEVRIEAPQDVDDLIVRFANGARRFFQVKISLNATGPAWDGLWLSFLRQMSADFALDDRIELVLGQSSQLASDLSEITKRHVGSTIEEWLSRLTTRQGELVSSVTKLLSNDIQEVWRVVTRLDISVWPSDSLERDFAPQWMPSSTAPASRLFRALSELAWEGATVRTSFDGPKLYDRLRSESDITLLDPPSWGSAQYRKAIAALANIEVPGTEFRQPAETHYLWPKCIRYDRDRRPDFDDDLPGWRHFSVDAVVQLENFPSSDLDAVVVIAGPGFGKTTLVHAVAQKVALAGLLPAIIPVPKLSESDLSIAEYLAEALNNEFDIRVDWRAAANIGAIVLLLDGLDEVSSDRRTLILERLKVYRASHPSVRWLMTVRDAAALAPPGDATMVELAPLQDEDVPRYVDFYRPGESGISPVILNRMRARPDLAHLVRIPIFLALMLVLRLENENLRRSDLLDTYLATLFRPAAFKVAQLDTMDTSVLRRIAERAAFDALETDTIGVSLKLLERCVNGVGPTLRTDDVREALVRRGVLRSTGLVRLAFPFPIVQEYLASAELLEHHRDQFATRLKMIARRPWAQSIQFALERHPSPAPLIDEILTREDDVFHTGLRLLGRCLANGMSVTKTQWKTMGDRLAMIWGRVPWRISRLIDGIIVDAFSQPLHPAVRARLGERSLIHDGAGTIAAQLRDDLLSMEVLGKLLDGNIEHMLNLAEMQHEVDRIGMAAFDLYLARCRREPKEEKVGEVISCLIGHMKTGCVDADVAFAAASDESLPRDVRLSAWHHSMRPLDAATEGLIVSAVADGGYHSIASAARALSSPQVDLASIIRLLRSPPAPSKNALNAIEYLIRDWEESVSKGKINELLATDGFSEEVQNLVSLYAAGSGNLRVFDALLARIPSMSAVMVRATVALFGHVLERSRVERAVSDIASRTWSAEDRRLIASSFQIGLTFRIRMTGMNSGFLEPIPPHPGRTAPFNLLKEWIAQSDYQPWDHLQLTLNAAELGLPSAINGLRSVVDQAMATPMREETSDGSLAARALEVLYANGRAPSLDELERLALSGTYNLASGAVTLIAKGGSQVEAEILMRLYESVPSTWLRSSILGVLEPLAGRLGLRITQSNKKLTALAIQLT